MFFFVGVEALCGGKTTVSRRLITKNAKICTLYIVVKKKQLSEKSGNKDRINTKKTTVNIAKSENVFGK